MTTTTVYIDFQLVYDVERYFDTMINYKKNNQWAQGFVEPIPFPMYTRLSIHRKKEEIWLSPMKKALIPTEMSNGQSDNTKTPPKSSITQL